jgi:hypothetical protein
MSRTLSALAAYPCVLATFFVREFTFWRPDSPPDGKLWCQSQPSKGFIFRLPAMGIKYYTHFVLTGEAEMGSGQEFSGIVEVNQTTESRFEAQEIEALLARNFDLDSNSVYLIDWSRLQ